MCLVYAWLNSQLKSKIGLLDRGSIRSSPDRLRISAGLFLHVLVYMGEKVDLHLVHPALNLSILDAGILIMAQQVRLIRDFCVSPSPLGSSNLLGIKLVGVWRLRVLGQCYIYGSLCPPCNCLTVNKCKNVNGLTDYTCSYYTKIRRKE